MCICIHVDPSISIWYNYMQIGFDIHTNMYFYTHPSSHQHDNHILVRVRKKHLPKRLICALANLAMSSIFREEYDFQVINVRQDLVFSAVFLDFDVFNFVGYFMDFMKITILSHLTYFSSLVPIQSYFFARIVCSTYGSIINE